MENYIKDEKSHNARDLFHKENQEIVSFMETPEVAEVFSKYDKSLRHLYRFYAA